MKHLYFYTIVLTFLAMSFNLQGQEDINYHDEMIASGEGPRPIDFNDIFPQDYEEFKISHAWRNQSGSAVPFVNTSELVVNSPGGRVRSSLIDTDNNIFLVAPSGGGLWTFDPTVSFNPLDPSVVNASFTPVDDLGSFMAITDIAQNPNNAQHIIIATGDREHGTVGNGLFQSFDGGSSFNPIASTSPTNNADFNQIRFVKFSPETINTIYMAAGRSLYRSTDSGTTWEEVFSVNGPYGSSLVRSLDFISGTGVILSVGFEGIYSSTTGDAGSFSILTNGIAGNDNPTNTNIGHSVVATHEANRDIAYAFYVRDDFPDATYSIHRTNDGGASWTTLSSNTSNSLPGGRVAQGRFSLTIGVHPTNPDNVIAGSVSWWYSEDGGSTWDRGLIGEVDYHSVDFDKSNPDVAYLGYDQGIQSVDFGNPFDYPLNNGTIATQPTQFEWGKSIGFNTRQVYYGDYFPQAQGDAFIDGYQDGGSIFKLPSNNGRRVLVGDGGSTFINKQDPTKCIASGQLGRLARNEDCIASPGFFRSEQQLTLPEPYGQFITQFEGNNADGNQFYIPLSTTIVGTTDGGDSFQTLANHNLRGPQITLEQNATDPIVYVIGFEQSPGADTDIIRIENPTSTPVVTEFNEILNFSAAVGIPERITVNPNDGNMVYFTTDRGRAFSVSNLDTSSPTVTSIIGNIPNVTINVVIGVKDEPNTLFAGTNIGLFYSTDNGNNWTVLNTIPYTQISDLRLRDSDKRLFVFTHGRGTWATTFDSSLLGNTEFEQIDFNVYPNPVDNVLNVVTSFNEPLKYVIYDTQGRVIIRSTSNEINVSGLSQGNYILHATSGKEIIGIKQFIKR